jgi:hypothetical protein
MIEYKGYLMSGAALMIHPNSPDWRAIGTVCTKTPQGSILEVQSIGGPVFTSKEAAEKHGLELCHAWIEEKINLDQVSARSSISVAAAGAGYISDQ